MMHAIAKRNMPVLVDYDRFGWVDADPDPEAMERRRQRTRRRELVNHFLAGRNYWRLMTWLGAKMPTHRRFLSIGEALALARLQYAIDHNDETRLVVAIARYFVLSRWHWLNLPNEGEPQ